MHFRTYVAARANRNKFYLIKLVPIGSRCYVRSRVHTLEFLFNVIKVVPKWFSVSVDSQFERNSPVLGCSILRVVGWWMVRWSVGQSEIKANSSSVALKVEIEAALGNTFHLVLALPTQNNCGMPTMPVEASCG